MKKSNLIVNSPASELAHLGFQRFWPSKLLSPWIQSYWVARQENLPTGGYTETLYPDGGSSLIFNFTAGPAPVLDFKADQILSKILFQDHIDCIGIRFNPGGAFKLFGINMTEVIGRDQQRDFFSVQVKELQAQLNDLKTAEARIMLIESWLLAKANQQQPNIGYFEKFVAQLTRSESSLDSMLLQLPLSRRQLERKFQQEIGLSPAYLKQLHRVKHARQIITATPAVELSRVAQTCGFYDQAHFIRHFQKITGLTPGQYKKKKMSQMYNF